MLSYLITPVQEIREKFIEQAGIRLLIKREDLNHDYISGNKWWKLKYNLEEAIRGGKDTLLTYGGAYSNHIFATAAAAHELNLKSIGFIRGEENLPLNHTLSFAKEKGMDLHYLSREEYRLKDQLKYDQPNVYIIPEGGSNEFAVRGVSEFAKMLGNEYEYLCVPVGTGGTLAGLIDGIRDSNKMIIGFPVLKGAHFLDKEIRIFAGESAKKSSWQLMYDYHFGGYAKTTPTLISYVECFKKNHNIPLEVIYTAKMMAGIYDLVSKGFFPRGSTVLAIHTGGLQVISQ